ncbi:MAG: histidine kinase [Opitutaceae bacterium]|nr:histidine kinase [Opitutaceae bacterium]
MAAESIFESGTGAPFSGAAGFSPVTRWALLTGVWLVVSAAFAVQIYALGMVPWATAAALALLDWGPWMVCAPVVIWLARRLPLGPKTWHWALPAHLGSCLVLVLLMDVGTSMLVRDRRDLFPPPPQERRHRERGQGPREERSRAGIKFLIERARMSIPVYWMLVAATLALSHQRRSLERERRALQAEAHLAEARLEALQAQFKPHFLFNTLNTIAELVYENPAAAEDMITSLSELLRTVLAVQPRRELPLREEIEFIERYCAIQRVRFADRLQVRYEIEPAAREAVVPALLLQPLVENAIIHGIAPERTAGTVFIRARTADDRLRLEVADTGVRSPAGRPDDDRPLHFQEGVGLTNTRARLAALYGPQHTFALERAGEGGVAVKIELPLRRTTQ